mgnify:FL=1
MENILHIADVLPTADPTVHRFHSYAESISAAVEKIRRLRLYAASDHALYIGTYLEACPPLPPLFGDTRDTAYIRIVSLYRW